jgi:cytidine diphosphoramidate kinase
MLTTVRNAEGRPETEYEPEPGRVFWITGLSGAGKTTVGRESWKRLRAAGHAVTFLDGDALRSVIAEDLDHSVSSRRVSAMRNARLCRLLAAQGTDVICATISMFHEVQRWNRENIPNYREIYLRVPLDELRRRDSKGIYAAAERGDTRHVVGLDVPAELPEAPDLVLDNYGALDVATAVDRILALARISHKPSVGRSADTAETSLCATLSTCGAGSQIGPLPQLVRRTASPPKREIFPTPAPLSDEARLLVALVRESPERAERLLTFEEPEPIKPLVIEEIEIKPLEGEAE